MRRLQVELLLEQDDDRPDDRADLPVVLVVEERPLVAVLDGPAPAGDGLLGRDLIDRSVVDPGASEAELREVDEVAAGALHGCSPFP